MVENLLNMIKDIKKNSIKTNVISYYSTKSLMTKLRKLVLTCKRFYGWVKNKILNLIQRKNVLKIHSYIAQQYNIIKTEIIFRVKHNINLKHLKNIIQKYDTIIFKYNPI